MPEVACFAILALAAVPAGGRSAGDIRCGPVSCVGVSMAPGLPEMSLSVPIWTVFFAMSDGVWCVLVPSLSLPVSEPLWEAQRLALQQAWLISGKLERTLRKTYLTRRRIALALGLLPTGFFGFGLPGALGDLSPLLLSLLLSPLLSGVVPRTLAGDEKFCSMSNAIFIAL